MAIWKVNWHVRYAELRWDTKRFPILDLLGARVANEWVPPEAWYDVANSENGIGNFAMVANGGWACDGVVVRRMPEVLRRRVEILPVLSKTHEIHMLNPIVVVDCLDIERSALVFSKISGKILAVRRAVFHQEKTEGVWLFKLPQILHIALCTAPFRSWVEENGFTGLKFTEFRL